MIHFFPQAASVERSIYQQAASLLGSNLQQPEDFQQLAVAEGCDVATAALHRHLVLRQQEFLSGLDAVAGVLRVRSVPVVIVPGAFYRENPRTGADGRWPRAVATSLGLPVETVPLPSTGGLGENAAFLCRWLQENAQPGTILVSVSKGGSDLKAALASADAEAAFRHVHGWINLCGILDGTPMADWLLSSGWLPRVNRFVYRIRGRSLAFLQDLCRFSAPALAAPLRLPAHLRAIHVAGFPLRIHLTGGLARRCHARLEPWGPNDGALLLAPLLHWPGMLCPIWGADHYLRPRADVHPLLAALFRHLAA